MFMLIIWYVCQRWLLFVSFYFKPRLFLYLLNYDYFFYHALLFSAFHWKGNLQIGSGRRGRDRMVVEFTTIYALYALIAYHH
jgi:hypothetical protein